MNMEQPSAIILSLLDEILLEILSRLSLNDLTSIPFVCRRFSNLLVNNPDFLRLRLLPTLHVFGYNPNYDGSFISVSVPLNSSNWSTSIRQPLPWAQGYSLVSLGRSVYIIGDEDAFCHDTWTKTTVPVACPLFPFLRCKVFSAINGKLYAFAVGLGTAIAEYDQLADEWRVVASCPGVFDRDHEYGAFGGVGAGGVFYLFDYDVDLFTEGYDVSAGQWVTALPGPLPERVTLYCVCGTSAGHVYMVGKTFEELTFWRWERNGGEWIKLEPPVVPQTLGIGHRMMMSFRCVAVRDDRVVVMVNEYVTHYDIENFTFIVNYILVYNVVEGSWSRGPDLPFQLNSELYLAFTEY